MAMAVYTKSGQFVMACDTPETRSVQASVTPVELMPMNPDRIHGQVFNESTAVMYLKWGPGASTTSYTTQVPPRGLYELPRYNPFVGQVTAVWASANGNARVTEAT